MLLAGCMLGALVLKLVCPKFSAGWASGTVGFQLTLATPQTNASALELEIHAGGFRKIRRPGASSDRTMTASKFTALSASTNFSAPNCTRGAALDATTM